MNSTTVFASIAAAALAAGCATEKEALTTIAAPELLVESLPAGAKVLEGGVERGTTPFLLRLPERRAYKVQVAQEGFLPEEFAVDPAEVKTGARVLVPLRPGHWDPAGKRLEPDDAGRLSLAGVELGRAGRCPEALGFLQRAIELDPRLPQAHKAAGTCWAKAGKADRAVDEYQKYLLYAPDAPDAQKVRDIISRAQGDIDLPTAEKKPGK